MIPKGTYINQYKAGPAPASPRAADPPLALSPPTLGPRAPTMLVSLDLSPSVSLPLCPSYRYNCISCVLVPCVCWCCVSAALYQLQRLLGKCANRYLGKDTVAPGTLGGRRRPPRPRNRSRYFVLWFFIPQGCGPFQIIKKFCLPFGVV